MKKEKMNVVVNEKMKEMKVLVKKNYGIVRLVSGILGALVILVIILAILSSNHQRDLNQKALTDAVIELGDDMHTQLGDMLTNLNTLDGKVLSNTNEIRELLGISEKYTDITSKGIEQIQKQLEQNKLMQSEMEETVYQELIELAKQFESIHTTISGTEDLIAILKEQMDMAQNDNVEQIQEIYEKMVLSITGFQKEYLTTSDKLNEVLETVSVRVEEENKLLADVSEKLQTNDEKILEKQEKLLANGDTSLKNQQELLENSEKVLSNYENIYKVLSNMKDGLGSGADSQLEQLVKQNQELAELIQKHNDLWSEQVNEALLSLKDQNAALRNQIDNQVSSLKEQNTALGSQIDNQVTSLKDQNTALGSQIDNQMTSLKEQNAALGSQIDNQVTSLKDQNNALGSQIDNYISSLKEQNTTLSGQINEHMSSIQNQNNTLQTSINNFQNKFGDNLAEYTAIVDAQYENLSTQYTAYVNLWGQKHDGLLSYLQTSMSQMEAKLNQVFQSVSNGKKRLASALLTKGVTVPEDASFAVIADGILSIQQNILVENMPGTISYDYHYHQDGTGNYPHTNEVGVEAKGNCYNNPVYHIHSGDSKENGGCYTIPQYHKHKGSSQDGGGCYGLAIIHHHVDGCYKKEICQVERVNYVTVWEGGLWYEYHDVVHKNCGIGTIIAYRSPALTHESNYTHEYNGGLICGYSDGAVERYELNCGKDTSTLEGYTIGCGKTGETVIGYTPSCGKVDGQIIKATIVFE